MSQENKTGSAKQATQIQSWLLAIIDSSDDAIISKSLDGIIESWNPAAERMYGYTEAEAVGQPVTIIIPEELWNEEKQILERLRAGDRLSHFETWRVRKDGRILNVSLSISPIKDVSGEIVGISKIARDITEQKHTERLLHEQEQDLSWVLDLTAQAPWTADPDGTILDFSERWLRLTGNTRAELQSLGWPHYVHPDDLLRTKQAWKHALRSGDALDVEHRLKTASGEYRWMQTRAYARRDTLGHIVRWYGATADIHDRKLAEQVLARQARLLDQTYEPILVRDHEDRIVFWNRSAERVYGWSAQDAIGKISHDLLRTILPETIESIQKALELNGYWTGELRHRTANGTPVNVLSSWVRESTPHGSFILETNFDISEQKRLIAQEEQIRAEARANRRYRELLEAAPDGIFEIAPDGRIVVANRVGESMFGFQPNELIGKSVDVLVPDAARDKHAQQRHDYNAHPVTRPMGPGLDLHGRRKDGSLFPVEISLSPVHTGDAVHVITAVRDITDRHQHEQHLRMMREQHTEELASANRALEERSRQMERANRLKNEFLASMSHELRTPLHTIIGFSELLKERMAGDLTDTQDRYLNFIHQDAEHLLELINGVLDLSKIEAGRLELRTASLRLHSCVAEAIAAVGGRAAAKSIQIKDETGAPDFLVDADPVRIKEILYNLLTNAIKFTPESGKIWVEAAWDQEFVSITVADTGIGIPLEEQKNIFENFYQVGTTTVGIREGTGLGLAICKHLVELHGGSLSVRSQPGQGSRFTFTLLRQRNIQT